MILLADTVGDGAVTKEVTEATSEAVQEVGNSCVSCTDCIFYWNKNYQAASEACQTIFTKINSR